MEDFNAVAGFVFCNFNIALLEPDPYSALAFNNRLAVRTLYLHSFAKTVIGRKILFLFKILVQLLASLFQAK